MTSIEVDAQLAAATDTLQKIAEAEGLDLNTLSVSEIEQSLAQLMGVTLPSEDKTASDETQQEQVDPKATPEVQETKSASDTQVDQSQLTNLDVSQALAKYAAAEGVDLTKLSREEYANVWNEMVDYLSSPQAEQDKTAAAEMQVKLAEADVTGRQFAQSFWDELQKLAAKDEDDKGEDKGEGKDHEKKETAAEEAKEEAEKKASFKDKVKAIGEGVKNWEARKSESLGRALRRSPDVTVGEGPMTPFKALQIHSKARQAKVDRFIGRAVAGTAATGAATAGTAAAAGVAAHRKSKAQESDKPEPAKEASADLDALVTERARQILVGSGINPDSGAKFASDQEIVDFLAVEKLRAAGFEVG